MSTKLIKLIDASALREALDAHGRYVRREQGGRRANLAYHDLSNCALEGVDLSEADLTGALLCGAAARKAHLDRAILYGADLRDADLREASLNRADLRGACLRGANLARAQMLNCDLREGQTEAWRLCSDCSGLGRIETASERVPRSLCILVPRHACPQCRSQGLELAEQARKSGRYAHVRLLDGDAADPGPAAKSEK